MICSTASGTRSRKRSKTYGRDWRVKKNLPDGCTSPRAPTKSTPSALSTRSHRFVISCRARTWSSSRSICDTRLAMRMQSSLGSMGKLLFLVVTPVCAGSQQPIDHAADVVVSSGKACSSLYFRVVLSESDELCAKIRGIICAVCGNCRRTISVLACNDRNAEPEGLQHRSRNAVAYRGANHRVRPAHQG